MSWPLTVVASCMRNEDNPDFMAAAPAPEKTVDDIKAEHRERNKNDWAMVVEYPPNSRDLWDW
jgi:hypothetical protein